MWLNIWMQGSHGPKGANDEVKQVGPSMARRLLAVHVKFLFLNVSLIRVDLPHREKSVTVTKNCGGMFLKARMIAWLLSVERLTSMSGKGHFAKKFPEVGLFVTTKSLSNLKAQCRQSRLIFQFQH